MRHCRIDTDHQVELPDDSRRVGKIVQTISQVKQRLAGLVPQYIALTRPLLQAEKLHATDRPKRCQDAQVGQRLGGRGQDRRQEAERPPAPHVTHNSGENEWYTPPEYIEAARAVMGGIDTDPASSTVANQTVKAQTFYSAEDDGLAHSWQGRVWMNPPYSQPLIGLFCNALRWSIESGNVTEAITLTNNATETAWFADLLANADAVCLLRSRVRFIDRYGNPSGAPLQGQAVTYSGPNVDAFANHFGRLGGILYADRRL